MEFHFGDNEELIYNFEVVLKNHGIIINSNSNLGRIAIEIIRTNEIFKKRIKLDTNIDVRKHFSETMGLVEFATRVAKHQKHKDFNQIIPHLEILNKANSIPQTTKSNVTDDGNNKLFELYIALLSMDFASNIRLDNPNISQGDNPDILFDIQNEKWAVACKSLHSVNEKTLYDRVKEGTNQIDKSEATKGVVIINFKNIIDYNNIWPIINQDEVDLGEEPLYRCFESIDIPLQSLINYGVEYYNKLVSTVGSSELQKLNINNKCPNGFVIFLQALTGVYHNGNCPPTILKTLNFIRFGDIKSEYLDLTKKLNFAMQMG